VSLAPPCPVSAIPLAISEQPQEPFGVIALPHPAVPVTDQGLQRAYAALLAHYRVPTDAAQRDRAVRPIGTQLDKALQLGLDRTRWTIHADEVTIIGSTGDRYRTTPAFCAGPVWLSRGKPNRACKGSLRAAVGMCVHQLAVELLRLAQELDPPRVMITLADESAIQEIDAALAPTSAAAPMLSEIAAVTLPGWAVFALCGAITIKQKQAVAEEVQLLLSPDDGLISISSGAYTCSVPAEPDARAVVVLNPESFEALWGAVHPAAMATKAVRLTVAVADDYTGTLTAAGGNLHVVVPSAAVPL
jgi:hypothetical protein